MTWEHDELLNDLAEHLERPERMMWRDMPMGPAGSQRPDVWTLNKSYANPRPLAYEVKVSIADYRSDVTSGKWQGYLAYSSGVYFCVPKGLITKADLPTGAGLMVRSEKTWRSVKSPTLQPVKIPQDVLLKLLIDGVDRIRTDCRLGEFNTYQTNVRIKKQLGETVATAVSDIHSAQRQAEYANKRIDEAYARSEQIIAAARERAKVETEALNQGVYGARDELAAILGLPGGTHMRRLKVAVERQREELSRDHHIQRLTQALERAQSQISAELEQLNPSGETL